MGSQVRRGSDVSLVPPYQLRKIARPGKMVQKQYGLDPSIVLSSTIQCGETRPFAVKIVSQTGGGMS